ncbi:hypothetical protein TrLO_g6176 [Triparma laevis f. longispina]|uniref:L-ornithine N(5)-oxygenase n=1 Tax=Triparma laevis f. longispina TaxID=1714387 RepID=A0A9W7FU67_9STRA|nr:hypothetical protein TrLO_g6176 [Triparma laevis f. longispina]
MTITTFDGDCGEKHGDCNACCAKTFTTDLKSEVSLLNEKLNSDKHILPPSKSSQSNEIKPLPAPPTSASTILPRSPPHSPEILDLLIIGAGPHSLSLLSRLVDPTPDLLTESERSHIMKKSTRFKHRNDVANHLKKSFDSSEKLKNTTVIDTHGTWLSQWRQNFSSYNITHLRSHLNLHPCPFDFQSLSVYAIENKRENELKDMEYAEKEEYRLQGFYGPFVLPSTSLFLDFCTSLVSRYGLSDLVQKGTVSDVKVLTESEGKTLFEVRLGDGRILTAKRVVAALGPGPAFKGMSVTKPFWAEDLEADLVDVEGDKMLHASVLVNWLSEEDNIRKLEGRRVLVIGGGQTSAHLAKVAIKNGASCTMASRKVITKKPYDIDVKFMGDKRPDMLKQFHKKTPDKKMAFNKKLRGGGSMSSCVYGGLVGVKGLELLEEVEVEYATYERGKDVIEVAFSNGNEKSYDYVWLATGGNFNLNLIPLFSSLQSQIPIQTFNGLPILEDDLSWKNNIPFHVMGAYAQMVLGADALNLAGARSGSVIVARGILREKEGS